MPSRVEEQVGWLREAGLRPAVRRLRRNLAVIAADRADPPDGGGPSPCAFFAEAASPPRGSWRRWA